MFEFEGDWFNATAVTAITRDEADVRIYVYGSDEPFIVECDDATDAARNQKEAVDAWRKALIQ